MEIEVRSYMDECNRLRVQLEEVIRSKDTFADPEELKLIEDRFAGQEQVINGLRVENSALITTINNKDDEIRTLRELFSEQSKRQRSKSNNKQVLKSKKDLRDKEREIFRLNDQLRASRVVIEEQRHKLEEASRKSGNASTSILNQSLPAPVSKATPQSSNAVNPLNSSLNMQSQQLKSDLQEKEQQVKELKSVIDQLESKMTQKNKDLEGEIADKNRFKTKYEEAMDKIAKLEAQLENGVPALKKQSVVEAAPPRAPS